jgi:23S rRNA G2069 N7-methylase RlmK/C1962 C5-methylase RlmI
VKSVASVRARDARPLGLREEPHRHSSARRGYKEINLRGLRLLCSGGVLVTSSARTTWTRPRSRRF